MIAPMAAEVTAVPRPPAAVAARHLAAGVAGGALAGFLAGGIGGRLAMLILRMTSSASLQGVSTDDGFTIGVVSGATAFLLLATTVGGVIGGLAYLFVRGWIPPRWRTVATATFTGLVIGAPVIRTDGIDFRVLDPLWLAVTLFVIVPAAYGALLALFVERFVRDGAWFDRTAAWAIAPFGVLLVPIVFLGNAGLPVAIAVLLAWFGLETSPTAAAFWRSPAVTWIGRGLLVVIAAGSLAEIVRDAAQILG
jgi:hypothetical protein